ncbi:MULTISPECIES: RagB/SusD family nutrient uptake outer membrane protein [Niastella]|uniref:RagB/SusD family nutrient uptake outer membrane protein n=1 Tax=Niastella soli TaxID=2821487 RepID=A0ABS3YNQ7_9BACT|nr:RagB/SusD family nutrient uptake outer membrane protein [Niastella soli]MBO9199518.1 RagB/SusD family nutrient uptake outer membrane protein [Niastella soli]
MNTIKYIIFLLLLLEITACKKYLDHDVEDKPRGTSINYSNLGAMYSPVSGVYRTACGENPGFVHWMDCSVRVVRGDDVAKGSAPNDQGTLTDIKNFQNSNPGVVTFWGNNNYWNDHYGVVMYCNEAMDDLDKYRANIGAGDAANLALYNQYRSEVRVIRAWAHMQISRVFGDVPILTDNDTLTTRTKSTVLEIRQWIMSEMDSAIGFLEDARPNQSAHQGAVTKYTALLLKAKAAADAAGNDNGSPYWDVVLSATNDIINSNKFSLFPDYYQLWKIPGKLSNESLLEWQFTDGGSSTGTQILPGVFYIFQGPSGDQKGSPVSGWGFLSPTQDITDFFNSRNDSVRLKTTILFAGANETSFVTSPSGDNVYGNSNRQTRFMGKAYLPKNQTTSGRTDYGTNNNIRVLRYADVLLLNAEAKVRKGQNGDVPFNLVHQRAKLNPVTGVTLQQVLDERRAEFACEWWGERYNDLIRTGQAATVLAPQGFTPDKAYVPIPQAQKDLDANL